MKRGSGIILREETESDTELAEDALDRPAWAVATRREDGVGSARGDVAFAFCATRREVEDDADLVAQLVSGTATRARPRDKDRGGPLDQDPTVDQTSGFLTQAEGVQDRDR